MFKRRSYRPRRFSSFSRTRSRSRFSPRRRTFTRRRRSTARPSINGFRY